MLSDNYPIVYASSGGLIVDYVIDEYSSILIAEHDKIYTDSLRSNGHKEITPIGDSVRYLLLNKYYINERNELIERHTGRLVYTFSYVIDTVKFGSLVYVCCSDTVYSVKSCGDSEPKRMQQLCDGDMVQHVSRVSSDRAIVITIKHVVIMRSDGYMLMYDKPGELVTSEVVTATFVNDLYYLFDAGSINIIILDSKIQHRRTIDLKKYYSSSFFPNCSFTVGKNVVMLVEGHRAMRLQFCKTFCSEHENVKTLTLDTNENCDKHASELFIEKTDYVSGTDALFKINDSVPTTVEDSNVLEHIVNEITSTPIAANNSFSDRIEPTRVDLRQESMDCIIKTTDIYQTKDDSDCSVAIFLLADSLVKLDYFNDDQLILKYSYNVCICSKEFFYNEIINST